MAIKWKFLNQYCNVSLETDLVQDKNAPFKRANNCIIFDKCSSKIIIVYHNGKL